MLNWAYNLLIILLIKVKMPTINGILTLISMINTSANVSARNRFFSISIFINTWNFMLSWVEHEKRFTTSRTWLQDKFLFFSFRKRWREQIYSRIICSIGYIQSWMKSFRETLLFFSLIACMDWICNIKTLNLFPWSIHRWWQWKIQIWKDLCCISKFMQSLTMQKNKWNFCVLVIFKSICMYPLKHYSWVKVKKSWTFSNQILKLAVCLHTSTISSLNGPLSIDKLKINQRSY